MTITSPIDITPTSRTCSEKCKLTYKFKTNGLSGINKNDHILINPIDNGSSIYYTSTTSETL